MTLSLTTVAVWGGGIEPMLGYVGLTLAVPILLAVVIALACAAVFVGAAALGIATDARWSMTLLSLPGVILVAAMLSALIDRWRRSRPLPPVMSLAAAADRRVTKADVGAKAANLARLLEGGARVPPSWVIPGARFERLLAGRDARVGLDQLALTGRWLRALETRLTGSSARRFVLRSSFSGEDGSDRSAPGVYESAVWDADSGRDALASALRAVWASYWAERALAYRGDTDAPARPCLAVLICEHIDHERSGFAASVDPTSGVADRRLVDQATGPAPWHGFIGAFDRSCTDLSDPGGRPPRAVLDAVSDAAGLAAELLGAPCEIEWGSIGEDVWIYQARPLSPAPPETVTLVASGAVELPPYPLTRLSADFLFDLDGPEPALPALTFHRGAPYIDARALARLASGAASLSPIETLTALYRLAGAAVRGPQVALPPPSAPRAPQGGEAALSSLATAADRVRTAVVGQIEALRLTALVAPHAAQGAATGPLQALAREGLSRDQLVDRLWFWAAREAELAAPRTPAEGVDAVAALGSSSAATGGRLMSALLASRETLKLEIALANHSGHQAAAVLDAALTARDGWESGDVFHLSLAELSAASLADGPPPPEVAARRDAWHQSCAAPPPAIVHLDAAGQELAPAGPQADGALTGFPLGGGRLQGRLRFADSTDAQDAALPRSIVVIPDASARWAPWAARAGAVAFERGGPLSHLALLCRERGVPAIAGAAGLSELRADAAAGADFTLDGDAGTLRAR